VQQVQRRQSLVAYLRPQRRQAQQQPALQRRLQLPAKQQELSPASKRRQHQQRLLRQAAHQLL
jgi:hypothetical protein